jgi:hypothetical protein
MAREKAAEFSVSKAAPALHADLRELILAARSQVAQEVNSGLTLLYWQIGGRIRRESLRGGENAWPIEGPVKGVFPIPDNMADNLLGLVIVGNPTS